MQCLACLLHLRQEEGRDYEKKEKREEEEEEGETTILK